MEINKIFYKVFGEPVFKSLSRESSEDIPSERLNFCKQIAQLNFWLDEKLKEVEIKYEDLARAAPSDDYCDASRLGPERVCLEVSPESLIRGSSDFLTIHSQGTFSTVKANVCVFGGKWMYEVQLQTKGVMQIGWCSNKCVFSSDTGVGDTNFSYGYDGSKQQIWHVRTNKYGDKWQTGDIITACLDFDKEIIEYYRNGVTMGPAFTSIEKGPGIALFPAVSVAFNEGLKVNFGGTPFKYYPPGGYQPLQKKPREMLEKADLLLGYVVNLSGILSRPKYRKSNKFDKKPNSSTSRSLSKKDIYFLIANTLVEKLAPILILPYVIEDKLLAYVMNLCVLRSETVNDSVILPGCNESTLGTMLSIFWNYMEEEETSFIFKQLLNILMSMFSQTPRDLEYEKQRKAIVILTCICNHPKTRKYYIQYKFFKKNFLPLFLYLRPPEFTVMSNLMPDELVWTDSVGGNHSKYLSACDKLQKSVETLYSLQKNLLKTLLINDDGGSTSSSRKIFLLKLRKYVMDNSMEQRAFFLLQSIHHNPVESHVALSFLCILVDTTRSLFEKDFADKAYVEPKYFFDGSFRYQHFDRVGGVVTHLRKVFHNEIVTQLGDNADNAAHENDNDFLQMESNDVLNSAVLLISGNMNTISILGRAQNIANERQTIEAYVSPGNVDDIKSLNELLDLSIIYYYAAGHKHIVKMSAVRDEIGNLNDIITETKYYRDELNRNMKGSKTIGGSSISATYNEILTDLDQKFDKRKTVFSSRSIELARKQAWYRAVALGESRRKLLIWLLDKNLESLTKSSELGTLFAFVPEVYINILPILLDTILDFSFHDIKIQFNISNEANLVVQKAAEFLGTHAADPRIILASCKDSLLQALGTLACHEAGIKALEKASSPSQLSLVCALLRPYENRAWGQSNWLLMRFWLGDGFSYKEARPPVIWQGGNVPITLGLHRNRSKNETHTGLLHHIAPAYPSKHFQKLIGKHLTDNEPIATTFLNSVLSQLNWAFSEFVLLLQEIQNNSNRQEIQEVIFEPRQLKICSMCFELTVSLMRSLEMVINVAPNVFHDTTRANSDLILNRVCQLISQVLSRVTVPPGSFQFVIDLCLPDLSTVTHFAIISAALGILVALLRDEIESYDKVKPDKITRVTRSLLTDPSFQIATLEYAIGEVKTPILPQPENAPRGNFDPKTRAHIDPLTNDVKVPLPSTSKRVRSEPPIIRFYLNDYITHVSQSELNDVERLIDMLLLKQTLLSDITLPSEDSLCPICCAKPVSVSFIPCRHKSCRNCILQHLLNNKVCFYCKTLIKSVEDADGKIIFTNVNYVSIPEITD